MKKLLVICGPTATGKTKLALHLAKVCNAEIISADSRQVYKGMNIGTGKDLPDNAKLQTCLPDGQVMNAKWGYYLIDGVKIWGYDLVSPMESFSVANYVEIIKEMAKDIWSCGKIPIIVGGTGFYIKGIVDGIETISIPPNPILRESLEDKTACELYEILERSDPVKAASLNSSDKKNPRRLIRAIEIADSNKVGTGIGEKKASIKDMLFIQTPIYRRSEQTIRAFARKPRVLNSRLFIGLTAPKNYLAKRIERRVQDRLDQGFEKEIGTLLKNGVSWENRAMQSLGYRQYKKYFEKSVMRDEFIRDWIQGEKRYVKRQITWFKKDKRIIWFDISKTNWEGSVERIIKKWYIKV